ncbi:hypothetical protein LCL95_12880 [Bacillus timonensis]|nr:hypothetical protein [Bacillus timonensis]
MEIFLFAVVALLVFIPIIIFLPLGFNKLGKLVITGVSFFLAIVGLLANTLFHIWQTALILLSLVIISTYFLEKRFGALLFNLSKDKEEKDSNRKNLVFEIEDDFNYKKLKTVKKKNKSDSETVPSASMINLEEEQPDNIIDNHSEEEVLINLDLTKNEQKDVSTVDPLNESYVEKDYLDELPTFNYEVQDVSITTDLEEKTLYNNMSGLDSDDNTGREEPSSEFIDNSYDELELIGLNEEKESLSTETSQTSDEKNPSDFLNEIEPLESLEHITEEDEDKKLEDVNEDESFDVEEIETIEALDQDSISKEISGDTSEEEESDRESELSDNEADLNALPMSEGLEEMTIQEIEDNNTELHTVDEISNKLNDDEGSKLSFLDEIITDDLPHDDSSEDPKNEESEINSDEIMEDAKDDSKTEIHEALLEEDEIAYDNMEETVDNSNEMEETKFSLDEIIVEDQSFSESAYQQSENSEEIANLRQQMFHTMISQIKVSRKFLSSSDYEQTIKEHLHHDLPNVDYYTFVSLLIEHYIYEQKYKELLEMLYQIKGKFTQYPIIQQEINYLLEQYEKK